MICLKVCRPYWYNVRMWIHLKHLNTLYEPSVYFLCESYGSTVHICFVFFDVFHILPLFLSNV
jgi:hypothetical protein